MHSSEFFREVVPAISSLLLLLSKGPLPERTSLFPPKLSMSHLPKAGYPVLGFFVQASQKDTDNPLNLITKLITQPLLRRAKWLNNQKPPPFKGRLFFGSFTKRAISSKLKALGNLS